MIFISWSETTKGLLNGRPFLKLLINSGCYGAGAGLGASTGATLVGAISFVVLGALKPSVNDIVVPSIFY